MDGWLGGNNPRGLRTRADDEKFTKESTMVLCKVAARSVRELGDRLATDKGENICTQLFRKETHVIVTLT